VGVHEILAHIDREITQLQKARAVLKGISASAWDQLQPQSRQRSVKKRNLTPEGRQRIAEAVKRRWARQKGQLLEASATGN
jgi:hypothetical protein